MVDVFNAIRDGYQFQREQQDADVTRQQRDQEIQRKDAAFNALRGTYGDVAGDPTRQGQLVNNQNAAQEGTRAQQTHDDATQKAHATQFLRGYIGDVKGGVAPEAALGRAAAFARSQGYNDDEVKPLFDAISADPTHAEQLLAHFETPAELVSGTPIIDSATGEAVYVDKNGRPVQIPGSAVPTYVNGQGRNDNANEANGIRRDALGLAREKQAFAQSPDAVQGVSEARARGTASGKAEIAAAQALPTVERDVGFFTDTIDSLLSDPQGIAAITGIGTVDGLLRLETPWAQIPGGRGADIKAKLTQVSDQAFQTAVQSLRGLGAVSNVEGQAARAARAQLSTAQSPKQLKAALTTLRALVQADLAIARRQASRRVAPASSGAAPASTAAPAAPAAKPSSRRAEFGL